MHSSSPCVRRVLELCVRACVRLRNASESDGDGDGRGGAAVNARSGGHEQRLADGQRHERKAAPARRTRVAAREHHVEQQRGNERAVQVADRPCKEQRAKLLV